MSVVLTSDVGAYFGIKFLAALPPSLPLRRQSSLLPLFSLSHRRSRRRPDNIVVVSVCSFRMGTVHSLLPPPS